MTINLSVPTPEPALKPRITVIGIGGAGGNAVNNMIAAELEGVEFVVANTDSQALARSMAERTLQLGTGITGGLGAGAKPDIGRAAAEESFEELLDHMQGSNMVFMAAGMGGGTGTGAGPVIARAAREQGILTVGVVTKPFHFEGQNRMRTADEGIHELQQFVDTLIVIPNQNLFRVANQHTTFADAFKMADDVLLSGVRGVTDLMVMPGLINLDFADIRSVMSEMGKAMMGTGEGEGDKRSIDASEAAISNPLLDDVSMKGARGVLINITGGPDMTLFEVDEAANRIREEVDSDANIIFGSTFDETLEGKMRVAVIATGIDAESAQRPQPTRLSLVSGWVAPKEAEGTPDAAPAAAETTIASPAVEAMGTDTKIPAMAPPETVAVAESVIVAGGGAAALEMAAEPAPAAEAEIDTEAPAAKVEIEATAETEPAPTTDAETETAAEAETETAAEPRPFIPPKPMATETAAPEGNPDPFAAAALTNGAGATLSKPAAGGGRGRGPSLLERVTGTGRARQKPAAKPAPAPTAPKATAQGDLGGLDPAERPTTPTSEDELLDIPAFLRRQAN
ncbi:MAG: cell division protein FtsZ [Alphaproteobacteria bacterium]